MTIPSQMPKHPKPSKISRKALKPLATLTLLLMSSASIIAQEAPQEIDPIVLSDQGTDYVCFTPEDARQVLADVKLARWYETEREPELVRQRDSAQAEAETQFDKRIEAEQQFADEQRKKRFWRSSSLTLGVLVVLLGGGLVVAL